ncbi:GTP 3',8-cyclase MoaA [Geothrix sp. PMB-07]|uniref:GTP 3',8-cyclase MoaA n=1 Tax=Geothrix sp. PMB-07 TaxID=3068640 RepID=UPI002741CE63|nr:radical SAM protein [Geothrix sp. PMB-07]WLT30747.1 radical SAM protein [Geothrix sp. PMB-07]
MPPPFTPPPPNHRPRMLRVRDGLRDGLGGDVTYLRVSLTRQSNLARIRGHVEGAEASPIKPMNRNETVHLVKVFTSLGVRKVRLTGGEPLLRRDLETIVAGISPEVEGRVHLTTNGTLLPRRARALADAGLLGVNLNLDAADRAAYKRITGKDALGKALAGLDAARNAGLQVKLNATVVRGWNEDQILPLVHLAQREGLDLRFIECMPRRGETWELDRFVAAAEILRIIREGLDIDLIEETARHAEDGPARVYRLSGPNVMASGKVGIISAQHSNACDRCNRVRLTSRGELKICRFGQPQVDLLKPLRQQAPQEVLVRLIRQGLYAKRPCHPLQRDGKLEVVQGLWQLGG